MQVIDRRKALSIAPIWRLAFRPFFLAGSVYALLAIPLWVATWTGHWPGFQPTGGWLAWHRHEMLFGFAMAIVAGFLLTAVQTWTGQIAPSGNRLMGLALLWLAARLGWLFGLPAEWLAPLDLLFLLALAWVMARMLWAVRQKRNYPIVVVLALMFGADLLVLTGLLQGSDALQRQGVLAGLWLVAALMALIGGRVIPFFTQRGLGKLEAVKPWVWLDVALLVGTGVIALLHAFGLAMRPQPLLGLLFAPIGVGHLLRLARWYDKGIWKVGLLVARGDALDGGRDLRPGALAFRPAGAVQPGAARTDCRLHERTDPGDDRPGDPRPYRPAFAAAGGDRRGLRPVQPGHGVAGVSLGRLAGDRSVAGGDLLGAGLCPLCLALRADAAGPARGWPPGLNGGT